DNQYAQVTIGLSIPIFSKLQTQTNISKSKVLLQDFDYMLEQQKQVLYKNIQQYHADAIAAYEKYISAMEAVTSNEEAFNYTQQKFEVGLVNSVDFNIAKNNLTKARSDLAQAKYEYIFKIKILDFYQGKPIQL
ncbi:MAG: TolC family protein, partial [Bacteroidales bacterium]